MRRAIFLLVPFLSACAALISLGSEPDVAPQEDGGTDDATLIDPDARADGSAGDADTPPPFVDTTFGVGGYVATSKAVGIATAAGDAGKLFVLGSAQESLALFHLTLDGADAGIYLQARDTTNLIELPQRMRVAQTGELFLGGDGQHKDAGHGPVTHVVAPDGILSLSSIHAQGIGSNGSNFRAACARQGPNVLLSFADFADQQITMFTSNTFQAVESANDMDALRIVRTSEQADLACLTAFPQGADDGIRFRVYTADAGNANPALDYSLKPSTGAVDVGVDGGAIALALAQADATHALVFGQTSRRDAFFMTFGFDGAGTPSSITQRTLDKTFGLVRAVRFGDRFYFAGCTDAPSRHAVLYRFSAADYGIDATFGKDGRVDLDGPLGECALDVTVDQAQRVYVLLGSQGQSVGSTRVARLK